MPVSPEQPRFSPSQPQRHLTSVAHRCSADLRSNPSLALSLQLLRPDPPRADFPNEANFPPNPNKEDHLFLSTRTRFPPPGKASGRFRTMAAGLLHRFLVLLNKGNLKLKESSKA